MENIKFSLLGLCLFFLLQGIEASNGGVKLFVFGDSFADTGNYDPKSTAPSWKKPYGVTFPGKSAGRWSDGRILADFVALLLGKRSPIPYRLRRERPGRAREGMNFAFGGTGVFNTTAPAPNLTAQIDLFQSLFSQRIFGNISNSIAWVSIAGNDYTNFQARNINATLEEFRVFIEKLITQLAVDIRRIQLVGVAKIVVTSLPSLGCFPPATVASAFTNCNEAFNQVASLHNLLLNQTINQINANSILKTHKIAMLDLQKAFLSSIQSTETGKVLFKQNLRPCCTGLTSQDRCGSVDEKGKKRYTVCEKPTSSFFWDSSHPTQTGWVSILPHVIATLAQLE